MYVTERTEYTAIAIPWLQHRLAISAFEEELT